MSKVLRGLVAVALLSVLALSSAFALSTAHPGKASADDASLELHAKGLKFDQPSLSVAAGANVTITLYNEDKLTKHDIAVRLVGDVSEPLTDSLDGVVVSNSCTGGCTTSLTFTAPGPGAYLFYCTNHMSGAIVMTGELDVQ